MASLYQRKGRLWLAWFEDKKRRYSSTGLPASEWAKGLQLKRELEAELEARKALLLPTEAPRSFRGYRVWWVEKRERAGMDCAGHDKARLQHARELDRFLMAEVQPAHVRDLVLGLKAKGTLAPRTVRHVFFLLKQMFEDARLDRVAHENPCVLRRGVLPGKKDKNPAWRATAVYAREEVETLLSDSRVPEDRRALYALMFLTGCRIGELADRRWQDYDAGREPLGALHVHSSFNTRTKKSKAGTKSGPAREVPVHPTLAAVLAAWKLGGWARMMGRAPEAGDLLIPTALGKPRTSNHVRNKLLADLGRLGLRARRSHDSRRTFISLGLADGGRKDILRWVSHGAAQDVMDLYTTLPWAALCADVARLNIRLADFATPQLHRALPEKGG